MLTNIVLIIFAVLLFNLIVFVHEFGHFFTAKLFGVKVNEFAIGMGPRILKFKKGDTIYALRAFPIGGFCDMEGEDEKSDSETSFGSKAVWKRMIIVSAGAIMNMILGLVMMFIILSQQNNFASTTIGSFVENSVSSSSGLMVGDTIISVDGFSIYSSKDLAFALSTANKSKLDIEVNRNGEKVNLDSVEFATVTTEDGKEHIKLDFSVEPIEKNFWNLIKQSFLETLSTVRMVWSSVIGLVTGKFSLKDMAGPVGAASVIGEAAKEGLKVGILEAVTNIISIMMMITVNLGIINLLPLPALDGGRLVFLLVELIFRNPINPKYEGWIHAAGFVLFILLMILITYSDVMKHFS